MSAAAAQSFITSAHKLLDLFPKTERHPEWEKTVSVRTRHVAAYCLVDLNDLWGNFCRQLVIDNASGRAKDLSGTAIVPVQILSPAQVIARVKDRRGHEPRWHNARKAIAAERKCASNKSSQISAALFSTTSPAPFLNSIRNYFCHRRSDCRQQLQSMAQYDKKMDFDAFRIGNYLRSDGQRNIEHWVSEFRYIALACAV